MNNGTACAGQCPLCGADNGCSYVQGKPIEACWCWKELVPKTLLERIPDERKGKACVCRPCVNAGESAERNVQD
ncbi:cysteine-rich CWC family protein [Paenibacillus validus]|uniref:cysteine-rich CWC family protein n=2 Tax=Paenibacillus TaxID=44249 RepID=UPI000FDA9989|nr:cysteine-rich CWC family protein [Paenibacillus validus]MED4601338.1 cysteine-rich CWC family protein [Paenibacillus validus]MED4608147.1 cysteine-rich CWC family protein [Paenibacillus validus]